MKWLNDIWFKLLFVFLAAVLQYSNTANHDYAWDDAIVLTENTRVQKGLSNIPELFENIKSNETQNRYGYRPIALLSFAADVELFGMDPQASHRMNILYYGILCVIVLLFLQTIFPDPGWRNTILTLLFVVHPIHTEVVANIKSRDEILAMAFGLLGLILFYKALLKEKKGLFVLSGILLVLAFHSKESAITFCGIAFLLPWYAKPGLHLKSYVRSSLPAILFLALLLAIRVFAYSDMFFQNNDMELYQKGLFLQDGFIGNPLTDVGFFGRIAMAIFLVSYFIYRFIVPYPLVHDYSYNQFEIFGWGDGVVWVAMAVLAALLFFGLKGFRKRNTLGFGLMFFAISASIYLHLAQLAPDIFGERYLFVPSLGLLVVLAQLYETRIKPIYLNVVFLLLMIPMAGYTWERNKVWKDNETLLKSDLSNLKNCVRANYNYALFLHKKYYSLPVEKQGQAQKELLSYYEHTLALTDRLFSVHLDLGAAYMEFGLPDKAYPVFMRACELYPNLSVPFVQMGKYYMSFSEYEKAIPFFEKALENGGQNSDYHYLLAICLFNSNQQENAMSILQEGEKLGVSSPAYHSLIARLNMKLGRKREAIDALKRGLKLYPTDQGLQKELNALAE